ncbi:MAG: dihydroorotate dehydrogenase electron transfer subunit [Bacteroidales bacterium]|nr:dihydroorotate dehydrogenase electron transfer subunit [Bacteroidales bacterium]
MKEIHDFKLLASHRHSEHYFTLVLRHSPLSPMPPVAPGQFVEVKVDGEPDVMLRRPISVHDVDPEAGTLSLLVQVVGKGTRRLSLLTEGDSVNVVYPLGHGFSVDLPAASRALLVGGGAGIAPLFYLAKVLKAKGVDCTILLGGRTADLIPVRDEFSPFGTLCLATDDGSLGHKGLVISHPAFNAPYDMIYTCGPTPMMKAVARSAAERGIRCEVSLENLMACGVGACLCCVTDTDQGHRCVCKDGPVFDTAKMGKWMNV